MKKRFRPCMSMMTACLLAILTHPISSQASPPSALPALDVPYPMPPSVTPPRTKTLETGVVPPSPILPWESPSGSAHPAQSAAPQDTLLLGKNGQLTLQTLLEHARANHPKLRIAQAGYAQALARLHLSESLYVPVADFSVSRSHTYTQNGGVASPSPLSPALPSTVVSLSPAASLNYLLQDGGKRSLSVVRERTGLLNSVYDWRTQWRLLAQTLRSDYLNVSVNRSLLEVQEEAVHMAEETLKQAEGLFRGGKRTRLDVLQSQADLEGARALYVNQKAVLAKAWIRLAADVGAPVNEFATLDPVLTTPFPLPEGANFLDLALRQRSDLLGFANQIAYQRVQVRLNNTQLNPTLGLLLSYGFIGSDFPALSTWRGALTFSVPLTQGPSVRAQNEQAEGTIVELLARTYDLRLSILGELAQNEVGLMAARQKVNIDENQVRGAEHAYRLAARRYLGGISQYYEVTNARQVLNNARVNLVGARSECRQAEIDLLSGIEAGSLPQEAPPSQSPEVSSSELREHALPKAKTQASPSPPPPPAPKLRTTKEKP